jgi:nucleoside-diphosphate-sugar epimerase
MTSSDPVCIIGRHGLIGSALAKRFDKVTSFPTDETKAVFHFGSYSHMDFELNSSYLMKRTLDEFTELLPLCQKQGIRFIYPSSALIYEKDNEFSRFKKILEQLASCYKTVSLGLRIFPVYGPGEQRSVISKWCREMKAGKQPVIYGDGKQGRDFIYVDDVADQIMSIIEKPFWNSKIVDIGSGRKTAFNDIVSMINRSLDSNIEPYYIEPPADYSDGICCEDALPVKVSVEDGINKILEDVA